MATSRPEELEDLLQPTLRADADPARMRGAWNPWNVAAFAIVGGPLTAGVLYGENYRRLGRPSLFWWCLAGALALVLLGGYGARWLLESGADSQDQERVIGILARGPTFWLSLGLAWHQQRRYRVFEGGGGEPGNLWKIGLVALLVGGFLGNVLMLQVLRWTS